MSINIKHSHLFLHSLPMLRNSLKFPPLPLPRPRLFWTPRLLNSRKISDCSKYRHFTEFPGMKILWKDTFCRVSGELKESTVGAIRIEPVFYFLPGGKENIFKILIFDFLKWVSKFKTFLRWWVKNNYMFGKCMKNKFHCFDFRFSVMSSSGVELDLKIVLNNHVFPVRRVHINDSVAFTLLRSTATNYNLCAWRVNLWFFWS